MIWRDAGDEQGLEAIRKKACMIFLILHIDTQNFNILKNIQKDISFHFDKVHRNIENLESKKPGLEFYWDSPLIHSVCKYLSRASISTGLPVCHGLLSSLLPCSPVSGALLCQLIHLIQISDLEPHLFSFSYSTQAYRSGFSLHFLTSTYWWLPRVDL